jgi:hypothetical protein
LVDPVGLTRDIQERLSYYSGLRDVEGIVSEVVMILRNQLTDGDLALDDLPAEEWAEVPLIFRTDSPLRAEAVRKGLESAEA